MGEPLFSLIAVGDIMLGGRTRRRIKEYGRDYPFGAVLPILQRSLIVLGNLEGPLACKGAEAGSKFLVPRETEAGEHSLASRNQCGDAGKQSLGGLLTGGGTGDTAGSCRCRCYSPGRSCQRASGS